MKQKTIETELVNAHDRREIHTCQNDVSSSSSYLTNRNRKERDGSFYCLLLFLLQRYLVTDTSYPIQISTDVNGKQRKSILI